MKLIKVLEELYAKLSPIVKKNKYWIKYVVGLILIFFVAYVGYGVYHSWDSVSWDSVTVNYKSLVFYFIVALFSIASFIKGWQMDLLMLNSRLTYRQASIVYLKSQLGKYVPGKVGLIITKLYESQKIGVSKQNALIASTFEMLNQMYAMLIIGIVSVYFFGVEIFSLNNSILILMLVGLALMTVFIFPKNIQRILNYFLKKADRGGSIALRTKYFYGSLFFKFLGTILSGLSVFFIVSIVYELKYEYVYYIVSISTIAFLLGFIAIFAPSGVGVRDVILLSLMSIILPSPIALLIAVLIRVLGFVFELSLIGLAYVSDKFERNSSRL